VEICPTSWVKGTSNSSHEMVGRLSVSMMMEYGIRALGTIIRNKEKLNDLLREMYWLNTEFHP
jgi:hypothetical protein